MPDSVTSLELVALGTLLGVALVLVGVLFAVFLRSTPDETRDHSDVSTSA